MGDFGSENYRKRKQHNFLQIHTFLVDGLRNMLFDNFLFDNFFWKLQNQNLILPNVVQNYQVFF